LRGGGAALGLSEGWGVREVKVEVEVEVEVEEFAVCS
jgi:hypothetical protein